VSVTVKLVSFVYFVPATSKMHCKKKVSDFPSPAGMSLTKLSLVRNNKIISRQGGFGW
jgi:hypothetical protein